MLEPVRKDTLNHTRCALCRREDKGFFLLSKGLKHKVGSIEPGSRTANSKLYADKIRAVQSGHNRGYTAVSARTASPFNTQVAERNVYIIMHNDTIHWLQLVFFTHAPNR